MEAITVGASLDKFLNVVIRKNAEALLHKAQKPHIVFLEYFILLVWGKRAFGLGRRRRFFFNIWI